MKSWSASVKVQFFALGSKTQEGSPPAIKHALMTKRPRRFYEARARVAKALAHPSRLLILDALKDKEWCVCDLTRLVGADQSTVSKHLAILKNAGIIEDRKEGSSNFYRLRIHCLDGFFGCMESVLEQDLRARAQEMARI